MEENGRSLFKILPHSLYGEAEETHVNSHLGRSISELRVSEQRSSESEHGTTVNFRFIHIRKYCHVPSTHKNVLNWIEGKININHITKHTSQ
jgi:hypothetical protein